MQNQPPAPPSPARQRLIVFAVLAGVGAIIGALAWFGSQPETAAETRHRAAPQGSVSSRAAHAPDQASDSRRHAP